MRLVDSDGAALARSRDALREALVRAAPDVVLLCYSHADPGSLVRLAEHWLPELAAAPAKPGWPYLPVCLCGLKGDAFDESAFYARSAGAGFGLCRGGSATHAALANRPSLASSSSSLQLPSPCGARPCARSRR